MSSGLLGEGSQHLNETVADSKHTILEPEVTHSLVLESGRQPELCLQAAGNCGQVRCNENYLAEPDRSDHSTGRYRDDPSQ